MASPSSLKSSAGGGWSQRRSGVARVVRRRGAGALRARAGPSPELARAGARKLACASSDTGDPSRARARAPAPLRLRCRYIGATLAPAPSGSGFAAEGGPAAASPGVLVRFRKGRLGAPALATLACASSCGLPPTRRARSSCPSGCALARRERPSRRRRRPASSFVSEQERVGAGFGGAAAIAKPVCWRPR